MANARKRYILAVEDNPIAREELDQILRDQGYTVLSVSSGEVAIAKSRDPNIDIGVILMDIRLNGPDGIEVARQIQEDDRSIPIILVSAYSRFYQDRIETYGLRIAAQIDKPLYAETLEKLLTVIKREFEKLNVRTQIQDEVLEVVDSPKQMHELLRRLTKSYSVDLLIHVIRDIGWVHQLPALDTGDMVAVLNYIAYLDMETTLAKAYAGQFVAFLDDEPVGFAKDRNVLIEQVYRDKQRTDLLIVEIAEGLRVIQRRHPLRYG